MEELKIKGFSKKDSKKVKAHLIKLLPYIKINELAIVGGLAIRHLLSSRGIKYPQRTFNDLDLMVKNADAVSADVQKDFLVYHYHPPKNGSFYIVLIDPELKIKVDIFDWNPPLEDFTVVKFNHYKIKIRSVEDQLVKTVFDIQRISKDKKVDPKQFQDTKLLSKIANMKKANIIWKKRNYSDYPSSIEKAIQRANRIAKQYPQWVKRNPFKKPRPYKCPVCQSTKQFKITPMDKIYRILNYVVE